MIEVAKLEQVYAAETAADKWWDGLSTKEQQAYIKAHPKSKYAQASKSNHGSAVNVKPIHDMLKSIGLNHTYNLVTPVGKRKSNHRYEFVNSSSGSDTKTRKALKSSGWSKTGDTYTHPDHPGHELKDLEDGDLAHIVRGVSDKHQMVKRHDWRQHA